MVITAFKFCPRVRLGVNNDTSPHSPSARLSLYLHLLSSLVFSFLEHERSASPLMVSECTLPEVNLSRRGQVRQRADLVSDATSTDAVAASSLFIYLRRRQKFSVCDAIFQLISLSPSVFFVFSPRSLGPASCRQFDLFTNDITLLLNAVPARQFVSGESLRFLYNDIPSSRTIRQDH